MNRHCPGAGQNYLDGTPSDERLFDAGTAAHAMIHAVAEATAKAGREQTREEIERITLAVGSELIARGREFEGEAEGQMPPGPVWRGRGLALDYLRDNPVEDADGADVEMLTTEVGLAFDAEWNQIPYSKTARWRQILDQGSRRVIEIEYMASRVLVVRDYKSAPSTDASELDTPQLKGQAVAAWLRYGDGDIDAVRQEVVNLFTGRTYARDLWLADGGVETLERWRDELTATMDALDEGRDSEGRYVPRAGGGCMGCPYVLRCDVSKEYWEPWEGDHSNDPDVDMMAAAFAWADGARDQLKKRLMGAVKDAPIETDEWRVGYVKSEKNAPIDGAGTALLGVWEDHNGDVSGLLAHAPPSLTQIKAAAKTLYPEDYEAREALIESMVEKKAGKTFKIERKA
jgi:hypothetical protein